MGCQSSKYRLNLDPDKIFIGQSQRTAGDEEIKKYSFNDQDIMRDSEKHFKRIYAIKVQAGPKYINAIQVAYEVANGSIISGQNHIVTKNKKASTVAYQEDVFEIKGDEFITHLSGTLDENLCSIAFRTSQGQFLQFGNSKMGTPFSCELKNKTLGPFAGTFGETK